MRKTILIAITFLLSICVTAQDKFKFSTQNYAGFLEGQDGTEFQIQSINGFKYKKWFAGIGAGLDEYYIRSVPVFVSLNRNIFSRVNTPYIFADGGLNFPWFEREENRRNNFISSKFYPSLYWSGGVGYKIGLKGGDAIVFNVGYSYKHLKETQEKVVFCLTPPCPPQVEKYNYYLNRLSFRFGWQL